MCGIEYKITIKNILPNSNKGGNWEKRYQRIIAVPAPCEFLLL